MNDDSPDEKLPIDDGIDPLLEGVGSFSRFLSSTSDGRKEIYITVMVDGVLISGIPISLHEYLLQNDITEAIREQMVKFGGGSEILESSQISSRYLHLKRAQFFSPGSSKSWPNPSEAGLWRCKLTAVSGFMFGRVAAIEDMAADESPHNAED
jgi:hypothetical protein